MRALRLQVGVEQAFVVAGPLALLTLFAMFGAVAHKPLLESQITTAFIYAVLVVSLYIFSGISGVVSFGSISFMAIGAYVGALVTIPTTLKGVLLPNLPAFLQHIELNAVGGALLAGGVAAAVAAVLSFPLMRLSGLGASLATLAVLVIVNVVASNWDAVTRGQQTMLGVPTQTTMNRAFIFAVVAVLIAFVFQESRIGVRLRAYREDEAAARAVGIAGITERRVAFTVSGFVGGIGGFAFAEFVGAFNPSAFYTQLTFLTLAMLVVGGLHSLAGAVTGAMSVSALDWALRVLENGTSIGPLTLPGRSGLREVGLAVAMLVMLLIRPEGLTKGREFGRGRWTRLLVRWVSPRVARRNGEALVEAEGTEQPPPPE